MAVPALERADEKQPLLNREVMIHRPAMQAEFSREAHHVQQRAGAQRQHFQQAPDFPSIFHLRNVLHLPVDDRFQLLPMPLPRPL